MKITDLNRLRLSQYSYWIQAMCFKQIISDVTSSYSLYYQGYLLKAQSITKKNMEKDSWKHYLTLRFFNQVKILNVYGDYKGKFEIISVSYDSACIVVSFVFTVVCSRRTYFHHILRRRVELHTRSATYNTVIGGFVHWEWPFHSPCTKCG